MGSQALLFLLFPILSSCSHFRGGTIMMEALNSTQVSSTGPVAYNFVFRMSWRTTYYVRAQRCLTSGKCGYSFGDGELQCRSGCTGALGSLRVQCTDCSLSGDWSTGSNKFVSQLPVNSSIEASFTGGDWISGVGGRWELRTRLNTTLRNGVLNTSPIAAMTPIVVVQANCNKTIQIPVQDRDGDVIRCRWAEAAKGECASVCHRYQGKLLETECKLVWTATTVSSNSYIPVALQVEDFESVDSATALSSIPVQFLIQVVKSAEPCSSGPVFIPPTRYDGSCIGVAYGTTLNETILVDVGADDNTVTEVQTQSPRDLMRHLWQAGPQLWALTYTWLATKGDTEPKIFCFKAVDKIARSTEQRCVTLIPGVPPPKIMTNSPRGEINKDNSKWLLEFNTAIFRPNRTTNVNFHQAKDNTIIFRVDVSKPKMANYEFRKLTLHRSFAFIEKEEYYVTLEDGVAKGKEFCGPETFALTDQSFWTFRIKDTTPPVLSCTSCPSGSRSSIKFSWSINEPATVHCKMLNPQFVFVTINCSSTGISSGKLPEGRYTLLIDTQDTAGNIAAKRLTFYIDTTRPLISNLVGPPANTNQTSALASFTCSDDFSRDCNFECVLNELPPSPTASNTFYKCTSPTSLGPFETARYNFTVRAIDGVGNVGLSKSILFYSDKFPPIMTLPNMVKIDCGDDMSPSALGKATATDNVGIKEISFNDTYAGSVSNCMTLRYWTAIDLAGNIVRAAQTISFSGVETMTVSGLPSIDIPCVDAATALEDLKDWRKYLTIKQKCERNIKVAFRDDPPLQQCNSNTERVWEITDDCGHRVLHKQTLRILPADLPLYPPIGKVNVVLQPQFVWKPYPFTTGYSLYVWPKQTSESSASKYTLYQTTYTVPKPLQPNTKYLWKLVYHLKDQVLPSPTWGFQTHPVTDLTVQSILAPPTAFTREDITIEWTVKNAGGAASGTFHWSDGIYISTTPNKRNARFLQDVVQNRILLPGDGYRASTKINVDHADFGTYYVFIEADRYKAMPGEIEWSNNLLMRPSPTEILLSPPPDLQVDQLTLIPESVYSGEEITVKYRVVNSGNGILRDETWYDRIAIDVGRVKTLHLGAEKPQLLPGSSYERSVKVNVPRRIFGDFNVTVMTDSRGSIFEHLNEANNIKGASLKIRLSPPPDLAVEVIDVPKAVSTDELLIVKYTVRNSGIGANYEPYWYDRIQVVTKLASVTIGTVFNRVILLSGNSYTKSIQYRIPSSLITGTYTISVVANSGGYVFEYEAYANNRKNVNIKVVQKLADLTAGIQALTNSATNNGNILNITLKVTNEGYALPQSSRLTVQIFARRGSTRYNLNIFIIPLLASGNAMKTQQVALPLDLYGDLDIGVKLNDGRSIAETDYSNNVATSAIRVPDARPSLNVENMETGGKLLSGRNASFQWTVRNQGISDIRQSSWVDALYFAQQGQPSSQWINLARLSMSIALFAGKTYTTKSVVPVPESVSGWGFIVVIPNDDKAIITKTPTEHYQVTAQIGMPATADLVPMRITTKQETFGGTRILTVNWEVENKGNSFNEETTWKDVVTVRKGDRKLQKSHAVSAKLNALSRYEQSLTVVLPAGMTGRVTVSVSVDATDAIPEYQTEDNNEESIDIKVQDILKPVFSVGDIDATVPSLAGERFNITYNVKNKGANMPSSTWQDGVYVYSGGSPTLENIVNDGVLLGTVDQSRKVDSGETYSQQVEVALPSGTAGEGKLFIVTRLGDARDGQQDVMVIPDELAFKVKPMPLPDLETVMLPDAISIETELAFFLGYTIKNIGKGRTLRPWWDKIYLSTDTTPDPFDKVLKSVLSEILLGANESYAQSVEISIPSTIVSGQYYLLVETGVHLTEETKEGNLAWKTLLVKQLPPSDLQVVSVTADRTDLIAGEEFNLEWTLANAGVEKAHGYKCDNQYLSQNKHWEIEDEELRSPICGRFELEPYQSRNKTYKYSSKSLVPFTTIGLYNGLVTVASNVYDVNLNNNYNSTDALSVTMPVLKMGVLKKIIMSGSRDRIFRITNVPDEAVLIIDLMGPPSGAFHNLYLKKEDTPTSGDYDVRSSQAFSVSQTIVAVNSAPGDFYLLITSTAEQNPYEIQLFAKLAEFEIHKVQPLSAALVDHVTFTVNGALFHKEMTVSLNGRSGEIVPTRITVSSISQAYITFALGGHVSGDYRMRMMDISTGKTIESKEVITLAGNLSPGLLSVEFNSGRALRLGETGTLDLVVKNSGNSDTPTPVFLLSAQPGGLFSPSFQEGSGARNEWLFLAPTTNDYWKSLTPGSVRKYSFSLPSPAEPMRLELKLVLISDSSSRSVEEQLVADLRETRRDLDENQWDALRERFLSIYGNNFESWKNHILDVVSEQIKYKRKVYGITEILEFMLNLADNMITDKLMEETTDIWEPTVTDILLSRRFSQRKSVAGKIGYFGQGWTTPLLDFKLLARSDTSIGLLIQHLPVYLVKTSENVYAGQGYSATANETHLNVTSLGDNVRYVLDINTTKMVMTSFRNRNLIYIYTDSTVEIVDSDENRLVLSVASHVGHSLCEKAVLQSREGKRLQTVNYEYNANTPRLISVTARGQAVSFVYNSHGLLSYIRYGNEWADLFKYTPQQVLKSLEKINPDGLVVHKTSFTATTFGTLLSKLSNVTSKIVYDITGRQIAFSPSEDAAPFFWETTTGGARFKLYLGDEVLQSGSQDGFKVTGINANRGRSSMVGTSDGTFEIHDPANNVFRMEFDKEERLKKYIFPDGLFESYSYKRGRMSAAVARDGTKTSLTYDHRGRLDNVTMSDGFLLTEYLDQEKGNEIRQLSNQNDVVNIDYDEYGQPVRVEHSDGHAVIYSWNALRQVTAIRTTNYSVSYGYNSHGKLVLVKDELTASPLAQFEYDPSGQLSRKTLGNGDYTTYAYHSVTKRINSLTNFYKNGTVASYFRTTFNNRGQRRRMETARGVWTYNYDAGGQISSWTKPNGEVTNLDYDKVLNRLVVTKGVLTTTYKHNDLNQMTSVDTLKLQYDHSGNLVYKENADGSRLRLRFNSINQLVKLDNEKYSCNFVYDPLGALMRHNCSDGNSTRYLTDYLAPYGYNVLARRSGGKQENFYYALSLGLLSAKDDQSAYFYHFDPDLSTAAITDDKSLLLNSYEYSPFGEDIKTVEQWLRNPFRHRGQLGLFQLPGASDKYMVRARVYDPEMGRFISMDPYHHGRQGTTNSYAYCNNNPLDCKDANGEWLQFVAAAGLIGGVVNTIATTGWSVSQGMSNGQTFIQSLPSLGNVAGSFVTGALTGAAIAGGALPGAMAGTTLVGGFVGGAAGTALSNAIDGKPQNLGSTVYNGILNGLGAKFLPPSFIGPYAQHLNNIVKHSYLYWITRNSFKESMKRFWKPFALTFGFGSGLGIFAGNFLDKIWNASPEWVRSRDPNDIIGPAGYGDLNFIPPKLIGRYKIRFENVENASAPAQKVVIKTEISESVELRTFRLGPIGFGEIALDLDYSKAMHRSALDLSRSRSYAVRIQAGIDVIERTAWWELTTVNASTGELIPDPLIGFLPPNNNASQGEGYVTYEIAMKSSLPHMSKVKAKAAIVFDENEVIETPEIYNTIDATKPSSVLMVQENISEPMLQIQSSDTGASVRRVNIYRLTSEGQLSPFLQDLEGETAILLQDLPVHENNMSLVSIASDNVGNMEEKVINASLTTVSVTTSTARCPGGCSGNGHCSSSGICNCKPAFIGLNCSEIGLSMEPPVLLFWVANATQGEAKGFIGYRLVSNASFHLEEIKLVNISDGIQWTGKGEIDGNDVTLKRGEIGNFSLGVYCHSHVGFHDITARYSFEPFVSRQYVVARFYITHDDCQMTTPLPTIAVPTSAGRIRPEILFISLSAAMFHFWFHQNL
ncbi:uncharacterized protein LOC135494016 [Lineus longissimus]|uniref:uncharacterized protein LOC135494016 n=1 Tax=Lineus longissimus TaxID=88925 RepID=UPI00315C96CF